MKITIYVTLRACEEIGFMGLLDFEISFKFWH
jgi:hypothetical protein